MKKTTRPVSLALGVALLVLAAAPAEAAKKPSKKSPHTQIVAVCRVETAPAEKLHKNNNRTFLEFDVTIVSYERVKGDAAADPALAIRQDRRIHVVHDLSCGGERLVLAKGDAAEIRGEYVAPDNGKDLIHFTHPADGSCGTKGGHPDGGIRKIDAAALKKAA
ncbi:MAG: hypothetical protein IPL89_11575 [Acidobacteria bacterium]|nr:hypothetical protein [Acidobacteriota bacterium]